MVLVVCTRGFSYLWSIYVVVIMFCKIISVERLLFFCWFRHWSDCLISICVYFGTTEGFTVDCDVTCGNVGFFWSWSCKF